MRTRILSTIFALLALQTSAWALEPVERTLAARAGERLELDLEAGGDIVVNGWERDEVQVSVRPGGRDQDNVRIDIDEVDGGVRVRSRFDRRSRRNSTDFRFDVKVPERYDLSIETTGGDVEISHVAGEIEGETMGGDLELRNLGGRLDFSTMGGEILLEDSDVDGEVSTMGGDVVLRNIVGDVDADTMGGDVRYQNVQRRQGSEAKVVKISTMGGRIDVPDAPGGADVETMGGAITVDRAAVFVKADTMGGDITIREIDGWVEAETMGGDVDVTMVGDPREGRRDVDLESMGGRIRLVVPDGLEMSFDVEIEITKHARRDYRIDSDFPIDVRERQRGRDRVLEGRGEVGGGKHRIRIRTVNGDVEIRRGS